jgi:5'-phosphate synthase pdxT subunit
VYVGVLALQGDFHKHLAVFDAMGVEARPFKETEKVHELSALVIPGGESTTIGMLMERRGMIAPLKSAIDAGLPVFGTCAGAILLAKDIENSTQVRLECMDIRVLRNAYGSQVDSFETKLDLADDKRGIAETIEGVFIRAPRIEQTSGDVEILALFDGKPVLVRQNNMLAATFHPELTKSQVVHRYFIERVLNGAVSSLR